VWDSVDALKRFTYQSDHVGFFRRRSEWFEPGHQPTLALWWIRAGMLPTVDDAKRRLAFLTRHGPTPYAFTFASAASCQPFVIEAGSLDDPVALALIGALNQELDIRYPEPGANFFRLDPDEVAPGRGAFLVARLDGVPVASGAIRRLDDHDGNERAAEIKRMYVAPEVRGQRVGAAVLAELEAVAAQLGVTRIVLETGPRQPDAIALYARAGYDEVECWGEYAGNPYSICMAKPLTPAVG
jgi:GNAT superfamily N-acetyltransferase